MIPAKWQRRGPPEDVCGGEEEAAALLLEGPRVPRAAGKQINKQTRREVSRVTAALWKDAVVEWFSSSFTFTGRPGRPRHPQVHGLVRKLHLCWLQAGLLPHSGTCKHKQKAKSFKMCVEHQQHGLPSRKDHMSGLQVCSKNSTARSKISFYSVAIPL